MLHLPETNRRCRCNNITKQIVHTYIYACLVSLFECPRKKLYLLESDTFFDTYVAIVSLFECSGKK